MENFRSRQRGTLDPATPAKTRVLIVEDSRSMGLLLKTLLEERWSWSVDWASSLAETTAFLEQYSDDYFIALCDLTLPDAEYGAVIDVMNNKRIPSVALTATFSDELREEILRKGVVDYILKDSINSYTYVTELVGRLARNANIKVLVIDDSASIRSLLKKALSKYRLQVLEAENGKEGLDLIKSNKDISLVVVDNNMPVMDGFTFTLEARKIYSKEHLAIIGISSTNTPALSARFLKNGANDFIYKPLHYEEVVSRVNQNLDMLELLEISNNAANRDFLTSLYNRRYFFGQGAKLLDQAETENKPICGIMLDIDHFKRINDTYGHDMGDRVIKRVGELFNLSFSEHLIARIGGEEFAALCIGTLTSQIHKQLDELREAIAADVIGYQGQEVSVQISAGIYQAEKTTKTLDNLMAAADQNLYKAKETGRNRVVS